MVKTLARKFRRRPKGQAGPLEMVIAWGKAAMAFVLMLLYHGAELVKQNLPVMQNISPLWVTIIVGAIALTIIGTVELRNEKDRGPETPKEVK